MSVSRAQENAQKQEGNSKNWKKDTFFAVLIKENPMGYEAAVLPDPLMRNLFVKCLIIDKNNRKRYIDNFIFLSSRIAFTWRRKTRRGEF